MTYVYRSSSGEYWPRCTSFLAVVFMGTKYIYIDVGVLGSDITGAQFAVVRVSVKF